MSEKTKQILDEVSEEFSLALQRLADGGSMTEAQQRELDLRASHELDKFANFTEEEIEALRLQDLQRASELRDRPLEEMKEGYCSELGYREVLHLSSVFFAMVETHLLEHPAILFDSKAYKLAFSAFGALHDLYQRIGQLENEAYEAAHLVAS